MARPKPTVILDHTDPKTYKSLQILEADGIYAVFMDGKPINLRNLNKLIDYPSPRYQRLSFSNPGHAFNLAQKLNKLFKTNKFAVVKLTVGEIIEESNINVSATKPKTSSKSS